MIIGVFNGFNHQPQGGINDDQYIENGCLVH
jgi:hypothetical protein